MPRVTKIPIPVDLTWGQASDLIDQHLNQIAYEKEQREKTKEKVRYTMPQRPLILNALFPPGTKVQHLSLGPGTILHAGNTLAGVQFGENEKIIDLKDLTILENH